MALFGIVASVMFALPAVHVLDDLGAVLAEVRAQASGLDPLRRAVALQRDLQAHRQLSDRVLRGDQTVEPQRAARQIEVDGDLSALDTQLGQMALQRARREVLAMQADWPPLAERVSERRIDAAESLDAHALLIEQTLQLIDLVADANRLQAWVDPGERQLARALTEHLPRWSEAQAQWRAAQQSGAAAALPAIAAQHRQAQARLLAALAVATARAPGLAPLQATLLAAAASPDGDWPAAAEELHEAGSAWLAGRLAQRQQSAETARAAWLAALALSALSALLAAGLGLRRSHEAVAGADTASTPTAQPHPDRAIAKRLLARLGQGRADPATGDAAATPPPTRREHH